MATLNQQSRGQSIGRTFFPRGTNRALAWLGDIMAGDSGDASGEDALSVLNRKIEESDLVARGSATPLADANAAWIFYRTDLNAFYIKDYDGTNYSWIGPVQRGDYQLRFLYHTADDPPAVAVTWNAANETFNVRSGNWTQSDTSAKWLRIVALPATSDTPSISPALRLGNPPAENIAYSRPNAGNFSTSVNNVKEALDEVNAFTLGGGTAPQPAASDVLFQAEESTSPTYSRHPNRLTVVGDTATFNFNIDSDLRNFSSRYNDCLLYTSPSPRD